MKKKISVRFLAVFLVILILLASLGIWGFKLLINNKDSENTLDPTKLRGFNLLSKILVGEWVNGDADEWAFKFMADEGFNFARIPMEVQELYTDSAYTLWNNDALLEMDRIIALGQKYKVHILLDLHALPGIRPGGIEPSDSSFTSDERLTIWKDIFYVISRRYQDVPSEDLSYNLINEPYQMESKDYIDNIQQVRSIIREVDSTKYLFIDPNSWTGEPLYELQSFDDPYLVATPHFYQPFLVTHYLAEWVDGADLYPEPEYPSIDFNGSLYGNYHPELHQPLMLQGNFPKDTRIVLRINEISDFVDLQVTSDKEILYRQSFQTNDDTSFWKEVRFRSEWNIYQNIYDKDVSMTLTQDTTSLRLELLSGDWLTLSSITLDSPLWEKPLTIKTRSFDWGVPTGSLSITPTGTIDFDATQSVINKEFLFEESFKKWTVFTEQTNIPVVSCEFGVYNKTNHDISLRVIEDNLALFKENNFGFALWNLSGAFGIFDSDRADVNYELYEGHQLDRQMLEMLKK